MGLALIICLNLVACSDNKQNEKIIGYWMNSYADTVSFTDEESCSLNNVSYLYKIYDKNHIQFIASDGYTEEYVYKIENGKLYLKYADKEFYDEYTKDEDEQQEIINNVKQQDLEAAEEIKKQNRIDEIQVSIDECQVLIEDAKLKISNNQSDIEKWEQDIEDRIAACEEAIAFGDDKEYQENQRDDFIAADNEAIQGCLDRIEELQGYIAGHESEIEKLQEQLEEVQN